jgi:hypothetical protein
MVLSTGLQKSISAIRTKCFNETKDSGQHNHYKVALTKRINIVHKNGIFHSCRRTADVKAYWDHGEGGYRIERC